MNRYDEFRRPGMFMLDVNFAKMTPITDRVRFQVRLEAFNLLNSPQYDERQYNDGHGLAPTSAASTATAPVSRASSASCRWDSD